MGFHGLPIFFASRRIFSQPRAPAPVDRLKEEHRQVTKPPESTPHSDLHGVHRDERRNVDSANDAGQDSGHVARAKKEAVGRPRPADDQPPREDRSR
jgi:hypothetical protein